MISIRECTSEADIKSAEKKHVAFVSKEVEKRIDFYINLFKCIKDLKKSTRSNTIENKVKIGLTNSRQYVPFISILFKKERNFNNLKYNNLKKINLLKPKARDFDVVIKLLSILKLKYKNFLNLDLSAVYTSNRKYYELAEKKFEPIDFLISKIFDYEDWFLNLSPTGDWGTYQLTTKLGMKVCSYCNRQYTFSISKGSDKITRPELDHFLPKNLNPLLALNFYNLIPSCTVCNRDCKGSTKFNYKEFMSPYELNPLHGYIQYDYCPTSYLGSIGVTDEINVFVKHNGATLTSSLKNKLDNNIKVFEYNSIAHEHRDVVQEIIRRRHISNDKYIETLQTTFPKAKLTLEEAYRFAYGNYFNEKDFGKRPLAKMTKDIAISVGALKKYSK